jgi:hypothetical protein
MGVCVCVYGCVFGRDECSEFIITSKTQGCTATALTHSPEGAKENALFCTCLNTENEGFCIRHDTAAGRRSWRSANIVKTVSFSI